MNPKIIYNVTVNIDESIHEEWKFWIKKHILEVLATGKFLSAKLTRVLIEEDLGGVTYSIQYTAKSRQALTCTTKKMQSDFVRRQCSNLLIKCWHSEQS